MIYFKLTDSKDNELAKSLKSYDEAEKLGRKLADELKCDITVWSTKPEKVSPNFYQYGYHRMITFCFKGEKEEMFTLHYEMNGEKIDTTPLNKMGIDLVIKYTLDNGKIPYEVRKAN